MSDKIRLEMAEVIERIKALTVWHIEIKDREISALRRGTTPWLMVNRKYNQTAYRIMSG